MRLTRIGPDEAVFGGIAFRKEGDDLVVQLTIRMRDGTSREELLRFRRKAL